MLSRLVVQNYQSIAEADLELAPVTLIVGDNFSGKSALLRALRALCLNQTGEEFIRHGESETQVEAHLGDAVVTWKKRRGRSASYQVVQPEAGSSYEKTGTEVPEEVQNILGVREIEIDPTFSLVPQFGMQWDSPLIVGESGARVAKILGKLTRLDVVVTAQTLCRRDRDRAEREGQGAEQEVARLQEQLDAAGNPASVRADLDALKDALETARQGAQRLELLLELRESLRLYGEIVQVELPSVPLDEALEKVRELERMQDVVRLYRQHNALAGAAEAQFEQTKRRWGVLAAEYEEACKTAGVCDTCPWR